MTSNIDKTLEQRGAEYGEFKDHARITQNLKTAMRDGTNWERLSPDKKEALEMVMHKMGRILNGNPDFHDSWHDIIGYTRLVEKELEPTLFPDTESTRGETPAAAGYSLRPCC